MKLDLRSLPAAARLAALLVLAIVVAPADAQVFRAPRLDSSRGDAAEGANLQIFPRPERATLQALSAARSLIAQERYGDAAAYLDAVLESPEDSFVEAADAPAEDDGGRPRRPRREGSQLVGVKAEAQHLLGAMPEKGLAVYRLRFAAPAQQMLDDALKNGNLEDLAAVSRRFFHTLAGYRATYLLGMQNWNLGRPLAAALSFDRLLESGAAADDFEPQLSLAAATCWLQAGAPGKARDTLIALKRGAKQPTVVIEGEAIPLFDDDARAVEWLTKTVGPLHAAAVADADWRLFRGNPARNAESQGGTPLLRSARWRVPVLVDPRIEQAVERQADMAGDADRAVLPAMHPLAVGDTLLMRDWRTLWAIDFRTGKRLWSGAVDGDFDEEQLRDAPDAALRQTQLAFTIKQRLWDDATFGTLSSDGQFVFCVEDLAIRSRPLRTVIMNQQTEEEGATAIYNRLAAYDVRKGKLKWNLGGPNDEFALRQAGTFFLGPPLPLFGQLYCIAERSGEGAIVLLALDAKTGDLLWSQTLAAAETSVLEDPLRRIAGLTPSYANGVLVCPTSVGGVVAVDLTTRWLLWGFGFPRADQPEQAMMAPFAMSPSPISPAGHWIDGAATIANDCVLLTPRESDRLYCVGLSDGKRRWSSALHNALYLACVYDDLAIVVNRENLRAFKLSNGRMGWGGRTLFLPPRTTPSGRGFRSGNLYYLPLSDGSVAAVDLAAGKIESVARSRRDGAPGNLICHGDYVISQGPQSVEVYYQLEPLRRDIEGRLKVRPDDAGALALQGEILLDSGKREAAIGALQQSYALAPNEHTRALLSETLLDGLRENFAEYRGRADEIEKLLRSQAEWSTYLRHRAQGLQQTGEPLAALQCYFQLLELPAADDSLEWITSTQSVDRRRWVGLRLARLLQETRETAAGREIEAECDARLSKAIAADAGIEGAIVAAQKGGDRGAFADWRRLVESLGDDTYAATARGKIADRLIATRRFLDAELLIWRDVQSDTPTIAGPATARLAQLLRGLERQDDAAWCYRRLAGELAEVPCVGARTGRELVAELPADSPLRAGGRKSTPWPVGLVESSIERGSRQQPMTYRGTLELHDVQGPFFDGNTFVFDQTQQLITARDAFGVDRWQIGFSDAQQQMGYQQFASAQAGAVGHLFVANMSDKLIALDTLGSAKDAPTRILWNTNFEASGEEDGLRFFNPAGGMRVVWQSREREANPFANGAGLLGDVLVRSRQICFQRYRELTAVDPQTGAVLWTNRDRELPPGCELFGDDHYVFALPPNENEALVFSAVDGQRLDRRALPPKPVATGNPQEASLVQRCIRVLGRKLLLLGVHSDQLRALQLFDPVEGKVEANWLGGAGRMEVSLIDDRALAVLDHGSWKKGPCLTVLSLPELKPIFAIDDLLKEPQTSDLKTFAFDQDLKFRAERCGDGFVFLISGQSNGDASERQVQPLQGFAGASEKIGAGFILATDGGGKLRWDHPAKVQQQFLIESQPAASPLLIFGAQEYRPGMFGGDRRRMMFVAVDKRTGRVYEKQVGGASPTLDVVADPEAHSVTLRLQQNSVVLKLTDQSLPDAAVANAKKSASNDSLGRVLMKALGRAIGSDADVEDIAPRSDNNIKNNISDSGDNGDNGDHSSSDDDSDHSDSRDNAANGDSSQQGEK